MFLTYWRCWSCFCRRAGKAPTNWWRVPSDACHTYICIYRYIFFNNPTGKQTAESVRGQDHSIRAGTRSGEMLSVWRRMGQSRCLLESCGGVLWGWSPTAAFLTSPWQLRNVGCVFQCRPAYSWAYSLHLSQKNPKYLGRVSSIVQGKSVAEGNSRFSVSKVRCVPNIQLLQLI